MQIDKTQLITILKEKYDYEVQRKLHFESILNIPVTMLGLLSAGIFYVLNLSPNHSYLWFNEIKPWCVGINMVSFTTSIVLIILFYFGYKREYKSFPNSDEVSTNFTELSEYYDKITPGLTLLELIFNPSKREKEIDAKTNERFKQNIIGWYVEINTHNSSINDYRGTLLFGAKFFIGISYLILILTYALSLANRF
ncbi:hypothetical protein LJ707_13295 [Mucilaginibacter sp. UR6-1]|uniref:hypothetical protein n=1 Tax=Mucilaginibacter sp. UR6-1 TaxID=1435643 RepID=UPI001E4F0EC4|nr:hypothetical protein [Mucilaginibacter sp. UR6-1]MCC8409907.1 hypothetical protein [Mucilaginibacter sp. UR6-1]